MWEDKKFVSFELQREYFGRQGDGGWGEGEQRDREIVPVLEDCEY